MKNFDLIKSKDGKIYVLIEKINGKRTVDIALIENEKTLSFSIDNDSDIRLNDSPYIQRINKNNYVTSFITIGIVEDWSNRAFLSINKKGVSVDSLYESSELGKMIEKVVVVLGVPYSTENENIIDIRNNNVVSVAVNCIEDSSEDATLVSVKNDKGEENAYIMENGDLFSLFDGSLVYEYYNGDYEEL